MSLKFFIHTLHGNIFSKLLISLEKRKAGSHKDDCEGFLFIFSHCRPSASPTTGVLFLHLLFKRKGDKNLPFLYHSFETYQINKLFYVELLMGANG